MVESLGVLLGVKMTNMEDPSWINANHVDGQPYKCEEASYMIPSTVTMFVPCGATATKVMHSDKDQRDYHMCAACAEHNLRRGMVEKFPSKEME